MPPKFPLSRLIGYVVLVILIVLIVILAVGDVGVYRDVQVEQQRTPTPVPDYAKSAMIITPDPSQPTPGPVLRAGASGEEVWKMQERLQVLGYLTGSVDGQFGPATKQALMTFQLQNGLSADGLFGDETRKLLYSEQARPYTSEARPASSLGTLGTAGQSASAGDIPLLVNRKEPLPDDYQPDDLVLMNDYCDDSIVKIKERNTWGDRTAVDALMEMLRSAHAEGITTWQISSAYRSIAAQQELFDEKVYSYRQQGFSGDKARSATRQTVADPGTSEHHTGLAFDITVPGVSFAGTRQALWLSENCWDYGFILRYTKEKEAITGFLAEAWHFRYVGVAHAQAMKNSGQCLEEYVDALRQQ